jgi:hypothetical protein
MAGAVRQPIDILALERFIAENVPDIEVPIDVKQVRPVMLPTFRTHKFSPGYHSLTSQTVRLWPVESYLPAHIKTN